MNGIAGNRKNRLGVITLTGIKICGLSRECDIDYANELMPEYIGYVFWDKSKRHIGREQAERLTARLKEEIVPVGVFVDEETDTVAELANAGIIRIVQLHGHEDEDYIKRLRELTQAPIIKAFKVRSSKDIKRADNFPSDYVLLDNGYGTGNTFDWSFVYGMDRPFFLAGGVNVENVTEAIRKLKPFAVDISSGVESGGYKDFDKMQAFVSACRSSGTEAAVQFN